MDPALQTQIDRARTLPDAELHQQMGAYIPSSNQHVAAKVELGRRESHRAFWRKDIWTWIAVAVSIASLTVAVVAFIRTSAGH